MRAVDAKDARLSGPRWLLRGICLVAAFPSAFFAAHGVLMSGQILNDAIPAGRVEAILGHAKTGPRLRLEHGQEVVFPYWALYAPSVPVQLAVGDQVEKRRDSFAYVVNGMVLTDLHWVLRNWLLPVYLLVPLGAYLIVGTVYVLKYGRAPLADLIWSDADPKCPRRPRTRVALIAAM